MYWIPREEFLVEAVWQEAYQVGCLLLFFGGCDCLTVILLRSITISQAHHGLVYEDGTLEGLPGPCLGEHCFESVKLVTAQPLYSKLFNQSPYIPSDHNIPGPCLLFVEHPYLASLTDLAGIWNVEVILILHSAFIHVILVQLMWNN